MIARDQSAIQKKLCDYFTISNIDISRGYLSNLSNDWYCFSFSLCRAAMRVTNRLAWWEAAINHILAWDGTLAALEVLIFLPNSTEKNGVILKDIFERVINYITFNQGTASRYPYLDILTCQYSFLQPAGPFEILKQYDDRPNEVMTIKENHKLSGFFSQDTLANILADRNMIDAASHHICLVHSSTHTCELSYNPTDHTWTFYNPDQENPHSFGNTRDAVNAIIKLLGLALTFEIACLQHTNIQSFPAFDHLVHNQPAMLVNYSGLTILANDNPLLLCQIINQLKASKKMQKISLNQTNSVGCTALICAAINGYAEHVEAIKVLCANGVDIDYQSEKLEGQNAIMMAVKYNRFDSVKALIEEGANLELTDDDQLTALMLAAQDGYTNIVKLLCHKGAMLNSVNSDGKTALMLAVINGHYDTVRELCHAEADCDIADATGLTALIYSIQYRHKKIQNLLIKQITAKNEETTKNQTENQFETDRSTNMHHSVASHSFMCSQHHSSASSSDSSTNVKRLRKKQ